MDTQMDLTHVMSSSIQWHCHPCNSVLYGFERCLLRTPKCFETPWNLVLAQHSYLHVGAAKRT
ncbi:hypothetical protein SCLCIDRAFT_1209087 [Scleroderma citrinum Foug A]|uniref:Uncharacterized protein n=1 Tax=Scleroderma citrinum Foug A TaxID=1036808 RepID=A0A0C3ELU0_9AGAM|nr:hypothetical protein SCLCIDRAFT_1209087 [Scleroderma citrinum Foug A]